MSLRCWRYSPSALPRFHSFVLYAFGNHQPLHSFPTRRSSDLDVGVVKDLATHDLDLTAWVSQSPYAQVAATRSEEHTSELQSRGHLVCRLLLEKKKSARTQLDGEHVGRANESISFQQQVSAHR